MPLDSYSNPIRRFLPIGGGSINLRIASNTTANCPSYVASSSCVLYEELEEDRDRPRRRPARRRGEQNFVAAGDAETLFFLA